ncbi:MAG: hypothetical protein AAF822_11115 [Pseudomonadota bacterium]
MRQNDAKVNHEQKNSTPDLSEASGQAVPQYGEFPPHVRARWQVFQGERLLARRRTRHSEVKIKYHNGDALKASTIAIGDLTTLISPRKVFENADRGCGLANFILAHEVGHISEGHHHIAGVGTRNFQLFQTETGLANNPPTIEELETNYAATFFLCGPAIFDLRRDAVRLGNIANCDISHIKKVRKLLEDVEFWKEMIRLINQVDRVTL